MIGYLLDRMISCCRHCEMYACEEGGNYICRIKERVKEELVMEMKKGSWAAKNGISQDKGK